MLNSCPKLVGTPGMINYFFSAKIQIFEKIVKKIEEIFSFENPSETFLMIFTHCGRYAKPIKPQLHARCNYGRSKLDLSKKLLTVTPNPLKKEFFPTFTLLCRMFPSLINCCTIDWFTEWPEDALEKVATKFLEDMDMDDEVNISTLFEKSNFCPKIQF